MKKRNKLKKILFVFNKGDIIGGGEISFLDLISHLDQNKIQPFVVCPTKGNVIDAIKKIGLQAQIIQFPTLRKFNPFRLFSSLIHLYKYVRMNKINLIHANGSRCAFYSGLVGKISRVPLFWHVRVMGQDKLMDSILSLLSSKIIVNSQAVRGRFVRNKNAISKVAVVYNGIDFKKMNVSNVKKDLRKEMDLSNSDVVFGMMGRMDNYKDHQTLLLAFKEVLEKFPQTKLLLAGDGEKLIKNKGIANELKLNNSAIFIGEIENSVDFYAAIDCFILATKSEGFGRVVIEAMGMKKPVIATSVGGVKEIIQDNVTGTLVSLRSKSELKKAMTEYLENKAHFQKIAEWAQIEASRQFSIEKHVEAIESLYNESLGVSSNHIRIGIDWRELEKGKATGIGRYLIQMVRYFSRPGEPWDLRLFGNQKTAWDNIIPSQSSRIISERITLIWDQITLPKAVKREKCDLFVSPYFKAPLFSSTPVVLIVNDLIPLKNIYFRMLLKWNIKKAVGIIAISETIKNEIIEFCPESKSKIVTIHLSVSSEFTSGEVNKSLLKSKYHLSPGYLLYVGNANPHKNLTNLFKACSSLTHSELVLCGIRVNQRDAIKKMISEYGNNLRVHILRQVKDEDLVEIYRGAKLFVFPSLAEGFGLPPLEAMACGIPVVASMIPTTQEILGNAAYFVNALDAKEITKGIETLVSNPSLLEEFSKKGIERSLLFTEKKMASSMSQYLISIYERKG